MTQYLQELIKEQAALVHNVIDPLGVSPDADFVREFLCTDCTLQFPAATRIGGARVWVVCPKCGGNATEISEEEDNVAEEHRFICKAGTLKELSCAVNHLIEKFSQTHTGQCYAHVRTLGEIRTISRFFSRDDLGGAELLDFSQNFTLEEREHLHRVEEDEAKWTSLDKEQPNWDHLKGLAESRERRLQVALQRVSEFEAEGNLQMLTKLAKWARLQSFCAIQRNKGITKHNLKKGTDQGKKWAKFRRNLGEGLDYRRYATLLNHITHAVARLHNIAPETLSKPFGLLKIKDLKTEEDIIAPADGDMLDTGCRVGEFVIDQERSYEMSVPSWWKSKKYVPTPRGIQSWYNPEYSFGITAL